MNACVTQADTNPNVQVVSPQEFNAALQQGQDKVYLLDVRTPDEYAQGHLAGAHQLNWLDNAAFVAGAASLP